MSSTKVDGRAGLPDPAATENDELIARAARRTGWAGAALQSAGRDLRNAHDGEGKAMTGVAEVVLEQAARLSHLAEDIESHRPARTRVPDRAARLV